MTVFIKFIFRTLSLCELLAWYSFTGGLDIYRHRRNAASPKKRVDDSKTLALHRSKTALKVSKNEVERVVWPGEAREVHKRAMYVFTIEANYIECLLCPYLVNIAMND